MAQEVVICLICKDWALGKLTLSEARRNLNEMCNKEKTDEELLHLFEVAELLSKEKNEKAKS